MSFLVIDKERFALQPGENTLGGVGNGNVKAASLAALPPFAVITVLQGMPVSIKGLGSTLTVRVEGYVLGSEARELRHGARIEVKGCRIRYGQLELLGKTTPVPGIKEDFEAPAFSLPPNEATSDTGGKLTDLERMTVYDVPSDGLLIGRDPICHIVLASTTVSRHHASISTSLLGYSITDRSTNGVLVNGTRVQGSELLRQGDVIRIGDRDFRFEADEASFEPGRLQSTSALPETGVPRSSSSPHIAAREPSQPSIRPAPRGGTTGEPPTVEEPATKLLFGTLEVLNEGLAKGMRFRIERPSIQIGRGPQNDVRLSDPTVSGAHATLVLRGDVWHLVDVGSTNGTFIDGVRITGERTIQRPAQIRFGDVALLFRPVSHNATGAAPAAPPSTTAARKREQS